ncbi:MAG: ThuA domain-containing protein [Flavobacteriaceae bacterium]
MSKYFFCFFMITVNCFGQTMGIIADKKVLLVWGGWEGHKPELFSQIVAEWPQEEKANFQIVEGVGVYDDLEKLMEYDLIVQSVTQNELSKSQEYNLIEAVKSGVSIAGAHGGIVDAFRKSTKYQFMIGGQWVAHPGGLVDFDIEILEDELTAGIENFSIKTEQYYMHFDPSVEIIAQTRFSGEPYKWIENVVMPVAWKKSYGEGKVFFISVGHDPNEFIKHPQAWNFLREV